MAKANWSEIAGEANTQEKLVADMIDGKKTVLTIRDAVVVSFKDRETGKPDSSLFVTFEEFPDHALKCNKGQGLSFQRLAEAELLSDDLSEWKGTRIPLEKYETKWQNTTYEKLRAVHPDEFVSSLKEYDRVVKGSKK